MVSGRRGISKCTAAVTSNLRFSSQEPLLFLYPAWARGITSQAAPIISNDAYPLLDGTGFDSPPTALPTNESISTRRADRPSDSTATKKAIGHDGRPVDKAQSRYERYKAGPLIGNETRSHRSSGERTDLVHHGSIPEPLPRRVVTGMKIRRILGNCRQLAEKENVEQSRRSEYYRMRRMDQEEEAEQEGEHEEPIAEATPEEILHNLAEHTMLREPGSVLQILVPEEALPKLLFGIQDTIMEIKHRTGAEIDLLEEEHAGVRILSLSGTSACVATAAAIILKATPGAILKTLPQISISAKASTKERKDSDCGVKARFVLTNPERNYIRTPIRADAVPIPDVWTSESLHTYVMSLTRMLMPSHIHRFLYEPREEHQMAVAELLYGVFDNRQCLQVMSLPTLNESISYFTKKNQTHFVRDIVLNARLRGLRLDTETFNIMLRSAAKVQDFDTFAQLFKSMVSNHCRPNSGTWLAFLAMLDDPNMLKIVVRAMKQRGLFHEAEVQAKVCEIIAPYNLQAALNRRRPTPFLDFAQDMENHFTKQWLTLSGANKLLRVLGSRGLISECWRLVDYMTDRGIKLDVVSGNTILDACCKFSGFKIGIDLLEPLMKDYDFIPDKVTWAILSKHVWAAQYYATARVIWRYGCLKGWISYAMRNRVADSVKKMILDPYPVDPVSDNSDAIRKLWPHNVGAFVTMGRSASKMKEADTYEECHEFAVGRVKDDTHLFMRYEPLDDPVDLMKRALAVDLESAERPAEAFSERLKWLDEHAPYVARKKRKLPYSAFKTEVAQTAPTARIRSVYPGSAPKESGPTFRIWRPEQQKSEEGL